MNIYNTEERKIRCITNVYVHGSNAPLLILKVGKEYTLVDIKVHSWFTSVYLAEFPNEVFNSVYFEEIK